MLGQVEQEECDMQAGRGGVSLSLHWNWRQKFDTDEPRMFHVVTMKNKEIHFVRKGGNEMAQLWVRGIKLMMREAVFGESERRV